jgi:predicted nucleic acid-binding protein
MKKETPKFNPVPLSPLLAKNLGLIHEVRPLVDELMIKKFRISDKIIKKTLKRAGEA